MAWRIAATKAEVGSLGNGGEILLGVAELERLFVTGLAREHRGVVLSRGATARATTARRVGFGDLRITVAHGFANAVLVIVVNHSCLLP